jgi:uncharacterized membrane protein
MGSRFCETGLVLGFVRLCPIYGHIVQAIDLAGFPEKYLAASERHAILLLTFGTA